MEWMAMIDLEEEIERRGKMIWEQLNGFFNISNMLVGYQDMARCVTIENW